MDSKFIGDVVFDFYKVLKREIEFEFKNFGIGVGQLQILMKLYEFNGVPVRQSYLIESIGVDKSNISRNLTKLLNKKLISIMFVNNRDKEIVLTQEGLAVKLSIMLSLQKMDSKMKRNTDENDYTVTANTLLKMRDNLN